MDALVEWGFDVFVLDRLHPNQGRLVAKGAITQPPKPMVRAAGGAGGDARNGEDVSKRGSIVNQRSYF